MFARFGIPAIVQSDNSPFNSREMAKLAEQWGFEQRFSSPMYPQSGGKFERAVKTIKNLMCRARESNSDVYKALLEYRVTPTESTNIAPATLFFNRNIRGILPVTAKSLQPADTNKLKQADRKSVA